MRRRPLDRLTAEQLVDPIVATWDEQLVRRIRFISVNDLQAGPRGGYCAVYSNHYWSVHPKFGAIIFDVASPQCNSDSAINEGFGKGTYPGTRNHFIRRAFVPVRLNDLI